MALSGSVSTSKYEGRYYTVSWSATQSTTNNTSTISWTLTANGGTASWYAERTLNVSIDGTTVYSKTARVERYKGTITSGTKTLTHSSDGTRSFTIKINAAVFVSSVNLTGSASFTLNTIARKSTISSAGNVTLGNACSVKWTPKSTAMKFKLKFSIGSSWSYTTDTITPSTTSAYTYTGYTIPLTCANYITSATTATMTVVLTTYSGSTSIGTSSSSFTVTVPSSCVPTISSVSISEATSGLADKFGSYIQNKSKLKVVTSATKSYGSSITSYTVVCQSKSYSGSSITTSTLTSSGTITLTITVKDARGRSSSTTRSVTVLAYSAPTISSFTATRCDSSGTVTSKGGYAKIYYKYTISALNNKNTRKVTVQYKATSATSYSTISSMTVNSTATTSSYSSTQYPTTSFSTESEYNIKITVSDYFTSVTKSVRLPSADTIMDILAAGTGMAFGKVAELANYLDIDWNLKVNGSMYLANNSYIFTYDTNGTARTIARLSDSNYYYIATGEIANNVYVGSASYTTSLYLRAKTNVYTSVATSVNSDARLKTDFNSLDEYDEVFDSLKPISYRYKNDTDRVHFGFTYQDIKQSLEDNDYKANEYAIVSTYEDENGDTYGAVSYEEIIGLLVYEVQGLKNEVKEIKGEMI